ncbi:hypothetical protein KIN20_014109 [Parelaphostrongylus tenuis]|uniref:Uncharacterized protein n=1 Tax=Parelaphostrongylus tenuis TaxID=148309 RepID=A0AAD5MD43_PARTN|nr:hypothetical protein KIN20_014109 [Parelaphostrongylus tenuis]
MILYLFVCLSVVTFNIPALETTILRAAVIVWAAVHARDRIPFAQEDPNLQFLCRGSLSDYAACQCKEDEGEVACINAQFVDTDVFINLNANYNRSAELMCVFPSLLARKIQRQKINSPLWLEIEN